MAASDIRQLHPAADAFTGHPETSSYIPSLTPPLSLAAAASIASLPLMATRGCCCCCLIFFRPFVFFCTPPFFGRRLGSFCQRRRWNDTERLHRCFSSRPLSFLIFSPLHFFFGRRVRADGASSLRDSYHIFFLLLLLPACYISSQRLRILHRSFLLPRDNR